MTTALHRSQLQVCVTVGSTVPDAPVIEPETEPRPMPAPAPQPKPEPFDPAWPEHRPEPQPKA